MDRWRLYMAWDGTFTWKLGDSDIKDLVPIQNADNNFKSYEDVEANWTISDYIFEAHTVKLQRDYIEWLEGEKTDYEPKEFYIARVNDALQKIFDCDIQMQISVEIARHDIQEAELLKEERSDDSEAAERIFSLVSDLIDYIDNLNTDYRLKANEQNYFLRDELRELIQIYERSPMENVLIYILQWLERLESLDDITEHELEVFIIDLNKQIDKIPKIYSEGSKKRNKIIKKIWKSFLLDEGVQPRELIFMAISKSRFDDTIDGVLETIANKLQNIQQIQISFEDILNDDYIDKLHRIEIFLTNALKGANSRKMKDILSKYTEGSSCFGILEMSSNCYFALSGTKDYEGIKWDREMHPSNKLLELAGAINSYLFEGKYIWARLTDDVRRYTEVVRDNNNIIAIPGSISLGNDMEIQTVEQIGRTYSCCERKMQAANGHIFINDKKFFARWAPCPKCVPALALEKGDIQIFAIAKDYGEWLKIKNNPPKGLQVYKIKPTLYKISN